LPLLAKLRRAKDSAKKKLRSARTKITPRSVQLLVVYPNKTGSKLELTHSGIAHSPTDCAKKNGDICAAF
jgi:hypothetical protein